MRISSRGVDGITHIANTVVPNQMLMTTFADEEREPRLTIGRENLALQGFPINIIRDMPGTFKETLLADLAGNMVSTPVFLAMLMSAIASVSWSPPGGTDSDADDSVDEVFNEFLSAAAEGADTNWPESGVGLMTGPTGLAEDGTKKRRGGLLNRIYTKISKKTDHTTLHPLDGPWP